MVEHDEQIMKLISNNERVLEILERHQALIKNLQKQIDKLAGISKSGLRHLHEEALGASKTGEGEDEDTF